MVMKDMAKRARFRFRRSLCLIGLIFGLFLAACGATAQPQSTTSHSQAGPTTQLTAIPLPTGPVTYVALGASDAVGVGSNFPGSQGYVPLIAAHLPNGSHMINLGISGIHLHEALTDEFPLALTTSPNLVTIWLVANDFVAGVTYSDYVHNLNMLLQQLHIGTHARIAIPNLPDLTRVPAFANESSTHRSPMLLAIHRCNVRNAQ